MGLQGGIRKSVEALYQTTAHKMADDAISTFQKHISY